MTSLNADALTIRHALRGDLEAIIALHADDDMGARADRWKPETQGAYEAAFDRLAATPGHTLYVAELGGRIVGTFLISVMPGLTSMGATLAQLRSVQVAASERSRGLGARMVALAEDEARRAGAVRMELTSNLKRADAHRFYERIGYARTHAGFRKPL